MRIESALPHRADPAESGDVLHPDVSNAARRLNELRAAQPADHTLQNLLEVLRAKLEICSQLPIYEYEASSAGHDACVALFQRLADVERRSFNDVLAALRQHLDKTAAGRDLPITESVK
jgi:hypothetical protein